MIHTNSTDAYEEIRARGLLGRRQLQVYAGLRKHGPCTAGELYQQLKDNRQFDLPANSNISTRLGELREKGCAKDLGSRACRVTGKKATVWAVTNGVPSKKIKIKKVKHTCTTCNGLGYVYESNQN